MNTIFIWFTSGELIELRHVQQIEWTRTKLTVFLYSPPLDVTELRRFLIEVSSEQHNRIIRISNGLIHKVDVIP